MRHHIHKAIAAVALVLACSSLQAQDQEIIMAEDAKKHIGDMAQVCGNVVDTYYARGAEGEPTYLNFTRPHPRHNFTVIIWGEDRDNFDFAPESLNHHQVCVYGKITRYRSRPQMSISIPDQISARPLPGKAPEATDRAEPDQVQEK